MKAYCSACGEVVESDDGHCPACGLLLPKGQKGIKVPVKRSAEHRGPVQAPAPSHSLPAPDDFVRKMWIFFALLLGIPILSFIVTLVSGNAVIFGLVYVGAHIGALVFVAMIYIDASNMKLGVLKDSTLKLSWLDRSRPAAWTAGAMFFFIVVVPLYLTSRDRLAVLAHKTLSENLLAKGEVQKQNSGNRDLVTGILLFVFVLLIIYAFSEGLLK